MGDTGKEMKHSPPSWINEEFIQNALRIGDGDPKLIVESIVVRAALALGENYCSDMFRVNVKLQGASGKRPLIVKILPEGNKKMTEESGMFPTETKIFSKLLPKMYKLLDDNLCGKYDKFSAKCLHSGEDPHIFIILEDLSVSGFRNAPRHKGLDMAHCKMVVQSLAKFHATSLAIHAETPECLESFKESIFKRGKDDTGRNYMRVSYESFLKELEKWPEYHAKYGSKLLNAIETILDKLVHQTSYKPGKFNVIIHGDIWMNNIMFKYEKDEPIGLIFVDFQMCTFTSPALDLQYFLHTSTNEEVSPNHWDQLIAEYHCTLTNTLHLLGCSQLGITLEQLKKDFDDHYFYGVHAAVLVLPIVMADPESGREFKESLGHLSNGEEFSNKAIYANECYMKRMLQFLPIFEEKGCFDV